MSLICATCNTAIPDGDSPVTTYEIREGTLVINGVTFGTSSYGVLAPHHAACAEKEKPMNCATCKTAIADDELTVATLSAENVTFGANSHIAIETHHRACVDDAGTKENAMAEQTQAASSGPTVAVMFDGQHFTMPYHSIITAERLRKLSGTEKFERIYRVSDDDGTLIELSDFGSSHHGLCGWAVAVTQDQRFYSESFMTENGGIQP